MNTVELNKEKSTLLGVQETMLNAALEAKVKLTPAQETEFANHTGRIAEIDAIVVKLDAIAKGKREVGEPTTRVYIPTDVEKKQVLSAEYKAAFWNAIQTRDFSNAALAEASTVSAADGSYLVPTETDPTIPALAVIEASARKLSLVVPTTMDIKLPFQASKTVAAAKAETYDAFGNNTHPFAQNVPTFNTTTLTAYMAGDAVQISWELLQDVQALAAFVTEDLNRAVFNYEENKFIGGSGSGEPLGYLNGVTAANTAVLSASAVLDLTGYLNVAYYPNAQFLMHRQTLISILKTQIAASQFQTYVQFGPKGEATLFGYPVVFSSKMPVYAASPAQIGAVMFGDFKAGWVIGDRGGSEHGR